MKIGVTKNLTGSHSQIASPAQETYHELTVEEMETAVGGYSYISPCLHYVDNGFDYNFGSGFVFGGNGYGGYGIGTLGGDCSGFAYYGACGYFCGKFCI